MVEEGYAPLLQKVEDKLSLKSEEYKKYINVDNLETKELVKKYIDYVNLIEGFEEKLLKYSFFFISYFYFLIFFPMIYS